MKLFSREPRDEAVDDFDTIDLPTKDDLNDDFFVESNEPSIGPKVEPQYGIEDAIKLMRTLPKESSELVVTVVNKTLRSMNVAVEDIIKGAEEKEKSLREQNKDLEQEVKELQARIADRNKQMGAMMADLRETMEVKKRLKLSLDIEAKLNRPAARPPLVESANGGEGDATAAHDATAVDANTLEGDADPNFRDT